MSEKIINLEQFKDLFTRLFELCECYCDIFEIDNIPTIRAKHNILDLDTIILFKMVYDKVFTKGFISNLALATNSFAEQNLKEIEERVKNEINKNRPTKNK